MNKELQERIEMIDKGEVPKGYKKSELGIIPAEWNIIPLKKHYLEIRNGFVGTATPYYVESGVKYLQGKNIKKGRIIPKDLIYVSEDFHIKQSKSQLKLNDIVMVQSGHVGECAVITEEYVGSNCHALIVLTPNDQTHSHFYSYLFNSKLGERLIYKIKTGNTIEHILASDMKKMRVPVPSLYEQQKVSSILSTWDKVIELKEMLIEQKKEQKKGLMQKLLTGEVRLPGFKGELNQVKLGEIGTFLKGKGIAKNQTIDRGINCVRYGEIYTAHHYYIKKFYSSINEEVAKDSTKIEKNDILFAGSGETAEEIGKAVAYINDEEAYAGGDIIILRPTIKVDSLFLSFLINTGEVAKARAKLGQGNSVVHIYPSTLSNLKILLPSFEEQQEIALRLKTFDDNLDLLEKEVLEFKEQKKGLMQLLLTGKVRVKV
jgi:type I restriction enzyme S subunit